jgi:hypothetical protein
VNQAPVCKLLDESHISDEEEVQVSLSPKRKRRDGKVPLVESEVRRSPRLTLLNDGFKNHDNCVDKNCLVCNAAPPLIHNKVVKKLAASFCKVEEEGLEKKLMKKNKLEASKKAPGAAVDTTATVTKAKKGRSQANGFGKDKGTSAAGGVAPQAKKRPTK